MCDSVDDNANVQQLSKSSIRLIEKPSRQQMKSLADKVHSFVSGAGLRQFGNGLEYVLRTDAKEYDSLVDAVFGLTQSLPIPPYERRHVVPYEGNYGPFDPGCLSVEDVSLGESGDCQKCYSAHSRDFDSAASLTRSPITSVLSLVRVVLSAAFGVSQSRAQFTQSNKFVDDKCVSVLEIMHPNRGNCRDVSIVAPNGVVEGPLCWGGHGAYSTEVCSYTWAPWGALEFGYSHEEQCPLDKLRPRVVQYADGRPLMVNGTAVFCDAVVDDVDDARISESPIVDARKAEKWTRQAQGEHASVGSFAVFSLQLMTNAAPPVLLAGASRAAGDEVRHAEQSFALASAFGGRVVTAGPLPAAVLQNGLQPQSLRELALAALEEGGIAETLSVLRAADQYDRLIATGEAQSALDQLERDTLLGIVRDETRHAALAWRTVAWASAQSKQLAKECLAMVAPQRSRYPFLGQLADILIGNKKNAEKALAAADVELQIETNNGGSLHNAAVDTLIKTFEF